MKTQTLCRELPCESRIAERPRYFPRQLITPDDLTLEQDYFRNRLRRHNRLLHGWGVVCGALVCAAPDPSATGAFLPWTVIVQRGYVLGPYGDEIVLDCERTVDLRTRGVTGITGEPCVEPPDPWCSDVFTPPTGRDTLYIAVRYKESMSRPVRVQPVGCGCEETQCEYSRWRDGYEIGVLTDCPEMHENPPSRDDIAKGPNPTCPDCPSSPWVGLAKVEFDPEGKITRIDNCSCRRLVVSFGHFWWQCTSQKLKIQAPAAPHPIEQGKSGTISFRAEGAVFPPGVKANLGRGVKVTVLKPSATAPSAELELSADVSSTADIGLHMLTVEFPDGSMATLPEAIKVNRPSTAPSPRPGGAVPRPKTPDIEPGGAAPQPKPPGVRPPIARPKKPGGGG